MGSVSAAQEHEFPDHLPRQNDLQEAQREMFAILAGKFAEELGEKFDSNDEREVFEEAVATLWDPRLSMLFRENCCDGSHLKADLYDEIEGKSAAEKTEVILRRLGYSNSAEFISRHLKDFRIHVETVTRQHLTVMQGGVRKGIDAVL